MDFCIITPTAGLERYATLSKTHMVLQHIADGDPAYKKFYMERRKAGDTIILDNGSYEMDHPAFDPYLMGELEPQITVLPDFFLQPWKKTWHAAIHHLDMYYDRWPTTEWCYIPQAEKGDLNGFLQSYTEASEDRRISWIGIPRALAYAISDNPLARVDFARLVNRERPYLKLHAFGMVNGDIHEIPYLAAAGVRSIDSSAPVWRGWLCNKIDDRFDRGLWDREGIPVDFSRDEPLDGWDRTASWVINHNLEACGVRISDRQHVAAEGQNLEDSAGGHP